MNEFVPRGYLTLEQAIEHFGRRKHGAEWKAEIDSIKLELQHLFFEEILSPKLYTKDGVFHPLPSRNWGSSEAARIWSTGESSVSVGPMYFEYVVYGRVLFEQASIDALSDGDSDDSETNVEDLKIGTSSEQVEPGISVDADQNLQVPAEQPKMGGNDQRQTQQERSAGSISRNRIRRKVGKRVGKYHKPMCAVLDILCSNHGLDTVEGWGRKELRQRVENHSRIKDKYDLPKDSQFRKVCDDWFDEAAASGKYLDAPR